MYVAPGAGFIVLIFAVLMAFGVIPFTAVTVGVMIAVLCLGFFGPLIKVA